MPIREQELNHIRVKVAAMCELAVGMCGEGIKALNTNDQALAHNLVARDTQVDELEAELEEMCLRFLALHAPKAQELRFVVAVSRMISELERIADHAKAIARQVHEHYCAPVLALLPEFADMTELVGTMLAEAVEAFFKTDVRKYAELVEKDRAVDGLQTAINRRLVEIISGESRDIDGAVTLLNVIRRLERIADHAKNIARLIPYIAEGALKRPKGKAAHADNDN